MDRSAAWEATRFTAMLALCVVAGCCTGIGVGRDAERAAAVKAGAAEWVPAPDGSAEFRYRSQP